MLQDKQHDCSFETGFFESILRRDRSYAEVIEILGGLYTKQGRIADGLKMDRRLVKLKPDNSTAHYNLACSLALTRRKKPALKELKLAIELGYDDFKWMMKDTDLEFLKSDPEFKLLFDQLRKKTESDAKR